VVNARLEGMDARLKSVDARLESVDTRLESVDARMNVIESTLLSSAEQIRMLARTASVGIRARRAHSRRLEDLEQLVEKLERKP
jgi:chromosome segregation ATPase